MKNIHALTPLPNHELAFAGFRERAEAELAALQSRRITLQQEIERTEELINSHQRILGESKAIVKSAKTALHEPRPAATVSPFDEDDDPVPVASFKPGIAYLKD